MQDDRLQRLFSANLIKKHAMRYLRGGGVVCVLLVASLAPTFANGELAGAVPQPSIVNDVTTLNPVSVKQIVAPHDIAEIISAVKSAQGPVSIGGGRYSMGGQTATTGALQLDMREFNKILDFSAEKKQITVQAGATWRQIQEYIDPHHLAVKIMQSYANFTVGGSLSVNVHGRYVGYGPLVLSVLRIGVVLADGRYIDAAPGSNAEIFYAAIGGYGGIGVITDATLSLADNVKVHRDSVVMPLTAYKEYFFRNIRDNPKAVFHNADIYPNSYDTVRATTFAQTDLPVTIEERLVRWDQDHALDRDVIAMVADMPGGKWIRSHVVDPLRFWRDQVVWRNYEASYSVMELEPESRKDATYVLQEYFVPVERFDDFVLKMARIFQDHKVNVLNVSIRHAKPDSGTLLAWAPQEVFAFVIYYKQGTRAEDKEKVGVWTRALIDAAIAAGGRYYLPYQIHATDAQFKAAYPGWQQFFTLKNRVDPKNKFRNKLWDAYYLGAESEANSEVPNSVREFLSTIKDYRQDEGQTFLTMPEWYLVYSPDEYAKYLRSHDPSGFPYFGSIGQFWGYYGDAIHATKKYPFNGGYHFMVGVIGTSFSVENSIKGVYENTIGRISEFTVTGTEHTAEDKYAAEIAEDYVRFIRVYPWYEYNFGAAFTGVWSKPPLIGSNMIRKWERKLILSAEYGVKTLYGGLIKLGTKAMYGDALERVYAVVRGLPEDVAFEAEGVKIERRFAHGVAVVSLPRYEKFRAAMRQLFTAGGKTLEIAGNHVILATVIAPLSWRPNDVGSELYARPILTEPTTKRVGLRIDVAELHQVLARLDQQGIRLEHLYDY